MKRREATNHKRDLKINVGVVLFSQILMLVANFFTKQAILLQLNAEYMGLQTVCANFCDMFSMAFSAAGMVMMFRLYKPLEEQDQEKLSALFKYFSRMFRYLSLISIAVGAILSLITVWCVSIDLSVEMVMLYYWMYLFGVLAYNRFLTNYFFLMADQKRYIAAGICGGIDLLALVFELYALAKTQNYGLFLVLIFTKNIIENGLIALYREKHYKYLDYGNISVIYIDEKRDIRKNIRDMVVSKIGTLLLYNSDSVIVSGMVSTAISGYYSCYYFIVYGLQFTMLTIFDTITPKIGRLSVKGSQNSRFRNYIYLSLFNIVCTAICVAGFFVVCEDFIILWVGEESLLDRSLVYIIAINLYFSITRYSSNTIRQAEGLFDKISWLILFRGVFNIGLSILMGLKFGFLGIIAATSISDALTVYWFEPCMVLKHYRKKLYFAVIYELLAIFACVTSTFAAAKVTAFLPDGSWLWLIIKIILVVLVVVVCLLVIFGLLLIIYKLNREKIDAVIDECPENEPEVIEKVEEKKEYKLKYSFILPVYNGEDVINGSINSVLEETDIDLELIVVDDGSTDRTYEIAKEYEEFDDRIRIIRIENCGQGLARNVGIEHATGDYIGFIDSDDKILWRGMIRLVDLAEEKKWDVICGNYFKQDGMRREIGVSKISTGPVIHGKNRIYNRIKTKSGFGYCWNKLFRAEFLRKNHLLFDDSQKAYMEDTLFTLKVFANDPAYYFCDTPVYSYTILQNSVSRRFDPKISEKSANTLNIYGHYLDKYEIYEANKDLMIPLAMRMFCWAQIQRMRNQEDRDEMAKDNIRCFINEYYFKQIVSYRKNIEDIDKITSLDERILQRTFFILLNQGRYDAVAQWFDFFYLFFRFYVRVIKIR